ncbi:hypothetical protein EDB19DRAFT_1897921 [Suillus lakei]|nr:hypothetical protein EDB19DRAFT_1897921 [Suillus lakei]
MSKPVWSVLLCFWLTSSSFHSSNQADWEISLARLTASTGLPLQWVENHKWKVLCDHFLLRAKIPSAKVLTQRANATLQCDGWTGENHHHLLGFMMTAQRKLHTVKVHDTSRDPQTAEELLWQILEAISKIETEWGATGITYTTDASEKFPHPVIPDCVAHQV